jgi:hypothetical protein
MYTKDLRALIGDGTERLGRDVQRDAYARGYKELGTFKTLVYHVDEFIACGDLAYEWGWDEPEVVNAPNNVSKQFQKLVYGETLFTWMPGPEPKLWIDAVGDAVVLTDTMAAILGGQAVKDAVADGHKKIEAIRDKFGGK